MELSNYSKIFKALSNEQRLNIFLTIYNHCCGDSKKDTAFRIEGGGCCHVAGIFEKVFTKICYCTKLSKSTVSHHIKELQNAGLINCERDGRTFRCTVNKESLDVIKKLFK